MTLLSKFREAQFVVLRAMGEHREIHTLDQREAARVAAVACGALLEHWESVRRTIEVLVKSEQAFDAVALDEVRALEAELQREWNNWSGLVDAHDKLAAQRADRENAAWKTARLAVVAPAEEQEGRGGTNY